MAQGRTKPSQIRAARKVISDRFTGYGIIEPGAREGEEPPKFNLAGLGRRIAGLFRPRTQHTPEEEETFKLRGQRAFYEAKAKRLGG